MDYIAHSASKKKYSSGPKYSTLGRQPSPQRPFQPPDSFHVVRCRSKYVNFTAIYCFFSHVHVALLLSYLKSYTLTVLSLCAQAYSTKHPLKLHTVTYAGARGQRRRANLMFSAIAY